MSATHIHVRHMKLKATVLRKLLILSLLKTGILLVLIAGSVSNLQAQSEYLTHVRPAFWYNSTDGVKVGARFFGYLDTPETDKFRVHAGFWVNTFMQGQPVSYDLRVEHPLSLLGGTGQAFTLGAQSRLMDGLQRHMLSANKQFKTAIGEELYVRIGYSFTLYEMLDTEYLLYSGSWSEDVQSVHQISVALRNRSDYGYQTIATDITGGGSQILRISASIYQELNNLFAIGFKAGHTRDESSAPLPEHGINLTYSNFFDWHNSPWFRSRGTLPPSAVQSGIAIRADQTSGVRGYGKHDANRFKSGDFLAIASITSINLDLEIANPADNYLRNIPIAGTFIRFQTRLFADAGRVSYKSETVPTTGTNIGSAGLGFQLHLNIPDYNNQARGFTLRWDLPIWVSDPIEGQNAVRPRHHLSFELSIPF